MKKSKEPQEIRCVARIIQNFGFAAQQRLRGDARFGILWLVAQKTILHVDMDAFFASVELLHHPEWRGRPLVVGSGPHERGVVSTCSYEARRFGVHSAMPSRTAYQLCPHAIFVHPHMDLYHEVSKNAFAVFGSFTPFVEPVSVDEAFLDVTGCLHLHGDPKADVCGCRRRIGEALRTAVRKACGVTCSVGLAPNRLLAKIGSEQNKPDGLTLMPFGPEEVARFLAPKPIGILWGIGKKTAAVLAPYGIRTCGDIQRMPTAQLESILGSEIGADALHDYAFGICDDTVYWEGSDEKSVSREHTFDFDESDRDTIRAKLLELVGEVGVRFRRQIRWARTAKLKLRDAAFNTITRQMPFDAPVRDDIAFRAAALALFDQAMQQSRIPGTSYRLIGFGVTNFTDAPDDGQPSLFDAPGDTKRKKRERLSEALDILRDKGLL